MPWPTLPRIFIALRRATPGPAIGRKACGTRSLDFWGNPHPEGLDTDRGIPAPGIRELAKRENGVLTPEFAIGRRDLHIEWPGVMDCRSGRRRLQDWGGRRTPNRQTPLIRIFRPNVWQ